MAVDRIISITEKLIEDLKREKRLRSEIPHVLVIEDDLNDKIMAEESLKSLRCNVKSFQTGEEGLSALYDSADPNKPNFDIVFLDLNLPKMDGVHVLKRIRELNSELPVVIITGSADTRKLSEAARLGYIGLVEKPLRVGNVQEILMKHKIQSTTEI